MNLIFALQIAVARPAETFVSTSDVWVRASPDAESAKLGMLASKAPFDVLEQTTGPGCDTWGAVDPIGWACLDHSAPTRERVVDLPVLLDYQPPTPDDYTTYLDGQPWTPIQGDPLLPFVYGRVWKGWRGPVYEDLDAWNAGKQPIGRLPSGQRAHFASVEQTPRGAVFVRNNGRVVPEADVYVFPIDRFQGRDLLADPLPDGQVPAWVVDYDGVEVSGASGPTLLPYHTALAVDPTPVDGVWTAWIDGKPLEVPVGPGVAVWTPAERPEGVEGSERWIDVDRTAHLLGVYDGDALIYATLISAGQRNTATPRGTFALTDKRAWADMRSRPGAADSYHVEAVPWIFHFKPGYALHGAYWHWGFGHAASHGCVNLAPRDAAWLFENVGPTLPTGWHTVYATEANPGAVLRIR